MRIRTGHGPDDWTESIEASPLAPKGYAGSLVVSASAVYVSDKRKAKLAAYRREYKRQKRAEAAA